MSHIGFALANLRHRPLNCGMTFASMALAFTLYGLSLGLAEGFRYAALAQHASPPSQFLLAAVTVSTAGMLLILVLIANAMAQTVRLRLHEFCVLNALGFSHLRITTLVVVEAAVPCLAGAVTGLVMAPLLFAAAVAWLPPLAAFPAPVYTPTVLAAGVAIATLMAILSAVVPALRIRRLDTAEVLTGRFQAPSSTQADEAAQRPDKEAAPPSGKAGEAHVITSLDLGLARQMYAATRIGLSTLRHRIKGGTLIVASVGCMVFVLLAMLAFGEGIRTGMLAGADPSRVVIRASSTPWLTNVRLPNGIADLAATAPGVARASDGITALAEAVTHDHLRGLVRRNSGETGSTTVVGVGPYWIEMTPTLRLLSGRMPRPGAKELIAGPRAAQKFRSLDSGIVQYRNERWRLVGTFTTGTWWDGFLVGPISDVRPHAAKPGDSAVLVRLSSPDAFGEFHRDLAARLPGGITLEREPDFYASYWRSIPKNFVYLAVLLTTVFGVGAIAAMAFAMQSAIQERNREIATLRILGFSGSAVAMSVLIESVLLVALGALCGAGLAWVCADGFMYNGAWTVFRVTVNLHLLLIGCGLAFSVAMIGAAPLAFKIARESEQNAVRHLSEAEGQPVEPNLARHLASNTTFTEPSTADLST